VSPDTEAIRDAEGRTDAPKAFISHSKEDKERFVFAFAKRLREKGVDAWLDGWEMLPGDSLVEKIFYEGIKECPAFIVVVSEHSIKSKWVHEELNSAIVKRIEGKVKVIPVRLDQCEIPEPLINILWTDIPDLNSYDEEFGRIVKSIFGQYDKPTLGERPVYAKPNALRIDALTTIDSMVLAAACNIAIPQGHFLMCNMEQFATKLGQNGVPPNDVVEAMEILHKRGYIKVHHMHGGTNFISPFAITDQGFKMFAHATMPDFADTVDRVGRYIVQNVGKQTRSDSIAEALTIAPLIVVNILNDFTLHGLIGCTKLGTNGMVIIMTVSAELRRKFGP
jgi:hypothetical protein